MTCLDPRIDDLFQQIKGLHDDIDENTCYIQKLQKDFEALKKRITEVSIVFDEG